MEPVEPVEPDSGQRIPRLIHQTWKTKEVPVWARSNSWINLNPTWRHRLWDDIEVAEFIASHFPQVWSVWDTLKPVEKADLFRYAVVYVHGGVYADLDVECVRPIDSWTGIDTSGVIGIEGIMKTKEEMHLVRFVAMTQYCQWTFAFCPGNSVLNVTINIALSRIAEGETDTLIKTGPGAFSTAIEQSNTTDLTILNGNAFAYGGYSNSRTPTSETLVKHGFRGSWK